MTSDPAALQQTSQPQVALTSDISVPISVPIKGASIDKQRLLDKNGISDTYYFQYKSILLNFTLI